MSQIELALEKILRQHPEIEQCYRSGLVNRRALARYMIEQRAARREQFDALIATIRRHDFGPGPAAAEDLYPRVRVRLKDRILILDFEREKALLGKLERLIGKIDYDKGDTLKIVVGTQSIKLFLDEAKEADLRSLFAQARLRQRLDRVSEISMVFPSEATATRNVIAVLTRELGLHGVVVTELLTTSPELLLYVRDDQVGQAYSIVRTLQSGGSDRDRYPELSRGPAPRP